MRRLIPPIMSSVVPIVQSQPQKMRPARKGKQDDEQRRQHYCTGSKRHPRGQ